MDQKPSSARLFAALSVPHTTADALSHALKRFSDSIGQHIPRSRWHVTLAFLGETPSPDAFIASLPQSISLPFFPVVSITHIGEGRKLGQLWAYAQPTAVLQDLHQATHKALHVPLDDTKEFIPHITLAHIHKPKNRFGVRDAATPMSFPAKEVIVFESDISGAQPKYTKRASITITS